MRSKGEVETKQGGEENLTTEPSKFSSFTAVGLGRRRGVSQESVRFYSALASVNPARIMQIYLFTLIIASHNGKTSKGQVASFTGRASAWAVRGSSEVRFSPCKELVVSLAHLGGRTTLTDEGLLLGKMAFGSILPRSARLLVSVHTRLWVYEGSMQ
jgi:hypothetical protein